MPHTGAVRRATGRAAITLGVAGALALVVALLALSVHTGTGDRIDHRLGFVVGGRGDFFTRVHAFTRWVHTPVLALLGLGGLVVGLLLRRPAAALAAPVVLLGGSVLTATLKVLVGAQRMPSGHVTAGMGLALGLVVLSPARLRLPVVAVAAFLAVGIAQAGVLALRHTPGDVVAAIALTTAVMVLTLVTLRGLGLRARASAPGPSGAATAWTIAGAGVAVGFVLRWMGAAPTGRRIDALAALPVHGFLALLAGAAVWWVTALTAALVDRRVSPSPVSSAGPTRPPSPALRGAPPAGG